MFKNVAHSVYFLSYLLVIMCEVQGVSLIFILSTRKTSSVAQSQAPVCCIMRIA